MQLLMIYRKIRIFRTFNEYSGNVAFTTTRPADWDPDEHGADLEDLDELKDQIDMLVYGDDPNDPDTDLELAIMIWNGEWD